MKVITSFEQKRQEKQIRFERKMLKELSLETLKEKANEYFKDVLTNSFMASSAIEEGSIDVAIESYLLGASYSRFGYLGEQAYEAKVRCENERKYLVDTLFEYIDNWKAFTTLEEIDQDLYSICESFVDLWWSEGFFKGEKRHRLRLH